MSLLAARDPLLPRSPDGHGPGAALSLLAHGALVAALAYGVSWRAPTPTAISAELWAAVPQTAAPPAPEPSAAPTPEPAPPPPKAPPIERAAPPPPQPDPQIAIEKARREKAEQARLEQEEQARQRKLAREKAEADKREKERLARAEAEKREKEREKERLAKEREARAKAEKEKAAEEVRLARQREDNLRRMMGQVESAATGSGAPGSRGTAAVDAAPSAAYAGRLTAAIKSNLIFDWRGPGNPAAVVEVRAAPSGTIMGRTLLKSSGHKDWDEAILRAIDRTARLPADTDGRVPAVLTITFRPRD